MTEHLKITEHLNMTKLNSSFCNAFAVTSAFLVIIANKKVHRKGAQI